MGDRIRKGRTKSTVDVRSRVDRGTGNLRTRARPHAWRSGRGRSYPRHTRGILRWLEFCSCEALADAIAGDVGTGRNAALRMTGMGQHADAAGLAHREQINDGNKREEQKGHLKDGRK